MAAICVLVKRGTLPGACTDIIKFEKLLKGFLIGERVYIDYMINHKVPHSLHPQFKCLSLQDL